MHASPPTKAHSASPEAGPGQRPGLAALAAAGTPLAYSLAELPTLATSWLSEPGLPKAWLLDGPVGAGKTTLVQAICHALGVTQPVQSPTFGLAHTYHSPHGPVHHLDLYRLEGQLEQALDAGLLDFMEAPTWCFVEWASAIPGLTPEHYLHLQLGLLPDGRRQLMATLI